MRPYIIASRWRLDSRTERLCDKTRFQWPCPRAGDGPIGRDFGHDRSLIRGEYPCIGTAKPWDLECTVTASLCAAGNQDDSKHCEHLLS